MSPAHAWLAADLAQILVLAVLHDVRYHASLPRWRARRAGRPAPPLTPHHAWWDSRPGWLRALATAALCAALIPPVLAALRWPLPAAAYLQADAAVVAAAMVIPRRTRPAGGPRAHEHAG